MLNFVLRLIIIFFLLSCSELTIAAETNQKLVVVLDWFANPNHAPIFVAQQQGFFKKNNLDVDIIAPADPADPPKWIAMGRADIALDYQLHVLTEIARGLPIVQIGTLIDRPLNSLVVLANSPVKDLSDLRGKTIAYSSAEIDLIILKTMLKQKSLSLKDVVPVNVHYNLTQALLSGRAAAVVGMMRNVELTQLKLIGHPGKIFFPENYGVPYYSELVFIAKQGHTRDNRYLLFFKALQQGREYLLQHPLESWQQFVLNHPELNNQLNREVWFNTLDKFAVNMDKINMTQCENLSTFLKRNN